MLAQPSDGEQFVDLGSGTGRAVVAAALAFPGLHQCVGVEIVPTLCKASRFAAERATAFGCPIARVELHECDFLHYSWEKSADIVWVSSLCMAQDTVRALQSKAVNLKSGARILTMDSEFGEGMSEFQRMHCQGQGRFRVEMSCGEAYVYAVVR